MKFRPLLPRYAASRALIVGIDKYVSASPLGYAVSDAAAIAALLIDAFRFPTGHVQVLLNEQATKENILDGYLQLTDGVVEPNDRVLIFFAGHGHTRTGSRGEIGYLVPHDGNTERLASLLR